MLLCQYQRSGLLLFGTNTIQQWALIISIIYDLNHHASCFFVYVYDFIVTLPEIKDHRGD